MLVKCIKLLVVGVLLAKLSSAEDLQKEDVTEIPQDCTAIGPPSFLHLTDISSNNLTLCWDPVAKDCPELQYLIDWSGQVLWKNETDTGDMEVDSSLDNCLMLDGRVPYTNYNICIAVSSNPTHITCSSATTQEDVPGHVQINGVLAGFHHSVILTWFPAEPANGIILQYQISLLHQPDANQTQTVDATLLEATFTNLLPCENYSTYIRAKTSAGWGQGSSDATFSLPEDNYSQNISCNVTNSREVGVCWEPVLLCHGREPQYVITWLGNVLWSGGTDSGNISISNSSETCTSLVDLVPYTDYQVCVILGNHTTGICCNLRTDEEASSPPTLLTETLSTTDSLSFNWSRPESLNGWLLNWRVNYSSEGNDTPDSVILGATSLSYTLIDLDSDTDYKIDVMAVNGAGPGKPANTTMKTLPPPSPPKKNNHTILIITVSLVLGVLVGVLVGGLCYWKRNKQVTV